MRNAIWIGIVTLIIIVSAVLGTRNVAKDNFETNQLKQAQEQLDSSSSDDMDNVQQSRSVDGDVPDPVAKTSKPTIVRSSPIPTTTVSPVNQTIVPSPTPRPTSTPTPTPTPDTQAPTFEYVTGPADGSTVEFNSFCFPLKIVDNKPGTLTVRYSFDNSGPGEWGQNYAPCYQNVSNGFHFFVVQARDAAGNTSEFVSRNFTVNVPSSPSPSSN